MEKFLESKTGKKKYAFVILYYNNQYKYLF